MSRWLRLYDDTINDPKVLKLPEAMRWHWIAMLCVASKNDGALPPLDDIAIQLRVTAAKVTEILATLVKVQLLDKTETGFAPHNWSGRQYKSDVSNERVKRYRERKCNVTSAVTVTPPETEQKQNTEQSRVDTRDDMQKRVGDFRQAIVRTYAECNSPTLPDTSRAQLWLSQGYDPEICLAVIAKTVAKKPNVGLGYFENAIKEAHESRAPARKFINGPPPIDWDQVLMGYKKFGHWSRDAGPDLTSPACRAPPEMLEKYGLARMEA